MAKIQKDAQENSNNQAALALWLSSMIPSNQYSGKQHYDNFGQIYEPAHEHLITMDNVPQSRDGGITNAQNTGQFGTGDLYSDTIEKLQNQMASDFQNNQNQSKNTQNFGQQSQFTKFGPRQNYSNIPGLTNSIEARKRQMMQSNQQRQTGSVIKVIPGQAKSITNNTIPKPIIKNNKPTAYKRETPDLPLQNQRGKAAVNSQSNSLSRVPKYLPKYSKTGREAQPGFFPPKPTLQAQILPNGQIKNELFDDDTKSRIEELSQYPIEQQKILISQVNNFNTLPAQQFYPSTYDQDEQQWPPLQLPIQDKYFQSLDAQQRQKYTKLNDQFEKASDLSDKNLGKQIRGNYQST